MSAEVQLTPEAFASFRTPNAYADMRAVIDPRGFVAASADHRFKVPFGRDGMEFIEDTMEFEPEVAEMELLAASSLQGTTYDPKTGESPGKMFHEHRFRFFTDEQGNRKRVDVDQEAILDAILVEWQIVDTPEEAKEVDELTVYFNNDTTQMHVDRVAKLCRLQGSRAFLDREVVNKDGETIQIRDSVKAAMGHIEEEAAKSPRGYVEYHEPFPPSHRNRYWKDGYETMLHEDGEFPNYDQPIAALVVQALTVDAYRGAAELFAKEDPEKAEEWSRKADELLAHILEDFWMEDKQFFAMALDRDPLNPESYRQVRRPTSDSAAVLRTNFLKSLPDELQAKYIVPVVERIFTDEFYTEAGIVCSSRYYPNPFDYVRYQGEEVEWAKDNYDIGFGLENYGIDPLADVVLDVQTNDANVSQGNYEYQYIIDGKPHHDPHDKLPVKGKRETIVAQRPEGKQAWSASGSARAKRRRAHQSMMRYEKIWQALGHDSDPRFIDERPELAGWRKELSERVLARINTLVIYKTRREAFEAIPTGYAFHIDKVEYERKEKTAKEKDPYIKAV